MVSQPDETIDFHTARDAAECVTELHTLGANIPWRNAKAAEPLRGTIRGATFDLQVKRNGYAYGDRAIGQLLIDDAGTRVAFRVTSRMTRMATFAIVFASMMVLWGPALLIVQALGYASLNVFNWAQAVCFLLLGGTHYHSFIQARRHSYQDRRRLIGLIEQRLSAELRQVR